MIAPEGGAPSSVTGAKKFAGQGARDRPLLLQGLVIEPDHRGARRRKRTLDAPQDIADHIFLDRELAVGGKLDHDGTQQAVFRSGERDDRQGAQSRREIMQADGPTGRRRARRYQNGRILLARKIEEVEQRGLVNVAWGEV